MAEHNSVLKL